MTSAVNSQSIDRIYSLIVKNSNNNSRLSANLLLKHYNLA
jgi:hypothetical protein